MHFPFKPDADGIPFRHFGQSGRLFRFYTGLGPKTPSEDFVFPVLLKQRFFKVGHHGTRTAEDIIVRILKVKQIGLPLFQFALVDTAFGIRLAGLCSV
jgi:hypothetical protein